MHYYHKLAQIFLSKNCFLFYDKIECKKITKMTETARTTVTLSKGYMDLVDELVGVFGNTTASVITNIVEFFLNDSKNDLFLQKLRDRKKRLYPPEESVIKTKIFNFCLHLGL